MSKLWDFIFKRDKPTTPPVPVTLLHQTFDINLDSKDYMEWLDNTKYTHVKGLITSAIKSYQKIGAANSPYIEIIKKNTYSGIAIKKDIPGYITADYKFILFRMVQILQEEQYIKKLSEVRSTQKGESLDLHYNCYLKPSIKIQQSFPINQLFGNIQIELLLRDDIFNTFRIKSMVYQDRNYQPAASFLDYMLSALSK